MNTLKSLFLLDESVTFLNFGSFGACPKPIFNQYQNYQRELELNPVQFITNIGVKLLADSRKTLSSYIHCHEDDIVYITNPSYGVNAVAKSLHLTANDEVLTTDLEYGACDKTWNYVCEKVGAKYIRQKIHLPILSTQQFIDSLAQGITANTKLIFISHITSSTALKLPVEEVCQLAKNNNIPIFIDGAHVPGQWPLDLSILDADYYVGACHKWMMTPKGSAFLYTKKNKQHLVEPLVVSWGYKALFPSQSQYLDWHQFNGTRDFSAFLCIPHAISFMEEHQWSESSKQCRALVKKNAPLYFDILNTQPLAPIDDQYILQMLSAEIKTSQPEQLYRHLYDKYKIEIPVMRHEDKVYLRFSINAFNTHADLDHLFNALEDIKLTTNFLF